ncbi:MAG: beta-galactosidase [Candidatus Omnitrophica bacterium]|nr:beta-galactosidase [Candidatus Omnitrophota bacterium]
MIISILNKSLTNKIICFIALVLLISFGLYVGETLLKSNMKDGPLISNEENIHNPFGVLEFLHWNHSWNSYKYSSRPDLEKSVSLMQEAGVGWVRLDFLWGDIEPQQGKFDFTKYDYIVQLLRGRGMHILGILHYSVDWASACGKWNCPPKENKLFIEYASRVIKRYKGQVKYWELWNEPDSPTYWKEQDGLKSYCVLLRDVYIAAKQVDPDCKILNGGLANGASSVNHLYDNGAKDYFDILNIHFFQNPLHPGAIKAVINYPKLAYKIMQRNGDGDKKIWITEIGCPGVKRFLSVDNWWLGKNPTEGKQAKWLKDVYTGLLKDPHVEKIFWAFFRDTKNHWNNGVDYFGLVRWDFSRKNSFYAYQGCFRKWFFEYRKNNGILKSRR